MFSSAESPIANTYQVEISGWDQSHLYFVEKSDLEWEEQSDKHVVLRHELPEGTIIFVRLLQPTVEDRSYPVPYHANLVRLMDSGRRQFRLVPVIPRLDGTILAEK